MYRSKALKKLPAKDFWSHNRFTGGALAIFATLLLASISAHAQGSPFDIYGGDSLFDMYKLPIFLGLASLIIQLPFSIAKDLRRRRQMRYGRRLKGPEMLTPKEFNSRVGVLNFRARNAGVVERISSRDRSPKSTPSSGNNLRRAIRSAVTRSTLVRIESVSMWWTCSLSHLPSQRSWCRMSMT